MFLGLLLLKLTFVTTDEAEVVLDASALSNTGDEAWAPNVPTFVLGGASASALTAAVAAVPHSTPVGILVDSSPGLVYGVDYNGSCITRVGDEANGRRACTPRASDRPAPYASVLAMSRHLLDGAGTRTEQSTTLFGAIVADNSSAAAQLLVNGTARHIAGYLLNALTNGFLEDSAAKVTLRNKPLPETAGRASQTNTGANITAVLFIVMAFAFLPGAVVAFVVKERGPSSLRVFPLFAVISRAQGSSGAVATMPFVWRSHAKSPPTRAGCALDIALRLE